VNRGGDRQLNWVLRIVALQRIRHHPETSAYYERLLAAGKSMREARRCAKRALARHFYHRRREIPTLPSQHRSVGNGPYVPIIFFSTPTPAATARSYSSGTVAESWRAIPVESKTVIWSSD
jgi:hypothetical protein